MGPPVIGSMIGTLVGEMVGDTTMDTKGLNNVFSKAGDKLAPVVGKSNVNKIGDITMTALGYSESEVCVCCPFLPASQILLVVTVPFFIFNLIKFGNNHTPNHLMNSIHILKVLVFLMKQVVPLLAISPYLTHRMLMRSKSVLMGSSI